MKNPFAKFLKKKKSTEHGQEHESDGNSSEGSEQIQSPEPETIQSHSSSRAASGIGQIDLLGEEEEAEQIEQRSISGESVTSAKKRKLGCFFKKLN